MFFDCFYNTIGCCEGKSDADVEHLAQVKTSYGSWFVCY